MALYHCVHGKSLFVVVFVGPCPFRFLLCFSAGWRNANLAGGSACRLLFGCFCVLFWVFDLPCYMTTGVNVEFISNCFFTCKDRALERDRPYQREKTTLSHTTLSHTSLSHTNFYTTHFYIHKLTHSSFTQPVLHHLLSFLPFPSHFHICLVIIGRS